MTALLDVRALTVRYDAVTAVDGLDLTVGRGEVVGLLGPNGAGKSSTLRAISRLTPATGDVTFDGTSLHRLRADATARMGIVHVPEGRRLFPNLTAEENLRVGATAARGRTATYTLDDVYDLFPPLTHLRDRRGWQLSGGEQQMIAIGRGLLAAPRLMLLDEPTLGLAPVVVHSLMEALSGVAREVSILIVEQNTRIALRLCTRAYVLVQGRVMIEGTADEVSARHDLIDSYLGLSTVDD